MLAFVGLDPLLTILPKIDARLTAFAGLPFKPKTAASNWPTSGRRAAGVINIDGREILIEATNTSQRLIPDTWLGGFWRSECRDRSGREQGEEEGRRRPAVRECRGQAEGAVPGPDVLRCGAGDGTRGPR
jgi:hypothetical protein